MPTATDFDISTGTTSSAVRTVLDAKYTDAGAWAAWGQQLLEKDLAGLDSLFNADTVTADLTKISTAVDAIAAYQPPAPFSYVSPDAPVYDAVPAYVPQELGVLVAVPGITAAMGTMQDVPEITAVLGSIAALPAVEAILVGDAPSTDATFTNSDFTSGLLDSLTAKVAAGGTGLGDAEVGLFARETARQNAARAVAYTEITAGYSAKGFELPPGGLGAKQDQANAESFIRLADSSAAIMAESAKLAQAWNQTTMDAAAKVVDILARVHDSKIMRDFEKAKNTVLLALEGFKQNIAVALAKADLNKAAISATVAANEGVVSVYKSTVEAQAAAVSAVVSANSGVVQAYTGQIQGEVAAINGAVTTNEGTVKVLEANISGQIEPIKAVSGANQGKAQAYAAAVQAAASDLAAQTTPEELKIKGLAINAQILGIKSDVILKAADLSITTASRQLALQVSSLVSMAQGAQQIIAGALNGVSVSTSLGYSAGSRSSHSTGFSTSLDYKATPGEKPPTIPMP